MITIFFAFLQYPCPKKMQINMTGFLNGKNARQFMDELWALLLSAQDSDTGIPAEFIQQKKDEIIKREEEQKILDAIKLEKENSDIDKSKDRGRSTSKEKKRSRSKSNTKRLSKSPPLTDAALTGASKSPEKTPKENNVKTTAEKFRTGRDRSADRNNDRAARRSSRPRSRDRARSPEKPKERKRERSVEKRKRSPPAKSNDRKKSPIIRSRDRKRSPSRSRQRSVDKNQRSPSRSRQRSVDKNQYTKRRQSRSPHAGRRRSGSRSHSKRENRGGRSRSRNRKPSPARKDAKKATSKSPVVAAIVPIAEVAKKPANDRKSVERNGNKSDSGTAAISKIQAKLLDMADKSIAAGKSKSPVATRKKSASRSLSK